MRANSMASVDAADGEGGGAPETRGWRSVVARRLAPMRRFHPAMASTLISSAAIIFGAWLISAEIKEITRTIHHADSVFDSTVRKTVAAAKAFKDTD